MSRKRYPSSENAKGTDRIDEESRKPGGTSSWIAYPMSYYASYFAFSLFRVFASKCRISVRPGTTEWPWIVPMKDSGLRASAVCLRRVGVPIGKGRGMARESLAQLYAD